MANNCNRLAVDILTGKETAVWVYDWARDALTRLTLDAADARKPVWTPDGRRIVFNSNRDKGVFNLYWQRADGAGEVQRLTESGNIQAPSSMHPSGKYLAFAEIRAETDSDLMILPIEGGELSGWKAGESSVFLNSPAAEAEGMFSPDGRWIAYHSNESGRSEIFVRPFPGPGSKLQISTTGGLDATWSRARNELLYRSLDNQIMTVSYAVEGNSFKAQKPVFWSEPALLRRARPRAFDLHPDGDRLAAAFPAANQADERDNVTFIFNFFDELRRILPPQ